MGGGLVGGWKAVGTFAAVTLIAFIAKYVVY